MYCKGCWEVTYTCDTTKQTSMLSNSEAAAAELTLLVLGGHEHEVHFKSLDMTQALKSFKDRFPMTGN